MVRICFLYFWIFLVPFFSFKNSAILHGIWWISGLFNMLSDSSHEIRQQADSALSEFLQEIKNSPVSIQLPMMSLFKSLFHYKYITLSGTEASCSWTNLSFVLCVQFLMILLALSKSVDYGRMAEILVQRAGSPDEFTRQTAITWVRFWRIMPTLVFKDYLWVADVLILSVSLCIYHIFQVSLVIFLIWCFLTS